MTQEDLRRLFHLCIVPRWGVVEMTRSQSVAEHSFKVIALARFIGKKFETILGSPLDWEYLLTRAMHHDSYEAISGDIPQPYKKRYLTGISEPMEIPDRCEVHFHEESIVVLADTIEAYFYAYKYARTGKAYDEQGNEVHLVTYLAESLMHKRDAFLRHVPNKDRQEYISALEKVFAIRNK